MVFLFLSISLILLAVLAYVDLRIRLLPNIYVLPFALCGIGFHLTTHLYFASPLDMAIGALIGGGLLYSIRVVANYYYQQDTLGLGDVKLMAAAGIWLGGADILLAVSAGAAAGLIHGIIYVLWQRWRRGEWLKLGTLSIPAGPGFIAGIIAVGGLKFATLPSMLDVPF